MVPTATVDACVGPSRGGLTHGTFPVVADAWGPRGVSPRGSGHVGVAQEAPQKQAGCKIGSLLGF
jgi:hypothetical protein